MFLMIDNFDLNKKKSGVPATTPTQKPTKKSIYPNEKTCFAKFRSERNL